MNTSGSPSFDIHFETTPNPASLKFVVNQAIATEAREFRTSAEAFTSPLASKIFGFPWTAGVFIGLDFITVTKQDWVEWSVLAEPLAGLIREHLESGAPVIAAAPSLDTTESEAQDASDDSESVRLIKQVINQEIRPAVAMDGGDIVFMKYAEGIVYLSMHGSCSGCPSSTMTLKMGVEARLKEVVPEIKEVVVP